jgi:acetyl esterase/lipase
MKLDLALIKLYWKIIGLNDKKRMKNRALLEGVTANCDICYNGDGSVYHLLDVYTPKGASGPLPTIIDIHGGGWLYGFKEINKEYCYHLAQKGFTVISINYRLFPEVSLPKPVQDIFEAFMYVNDNAKQLGVDLNNIFLTGDSAGAYYCALALGIYADEELAKLYEVKPSIKIKAVGYTCGIFEPSYMEKIITSLPKTYLSLFFDKQKDYKKHKLYSSIDIKNHKLELFPPQFLSSNFKDIFVRNTENFKKVLDDKGIKFEYDFVEKESAKNKLHHVSNILFPDWEESVATNNHMIEFLKRFIA